MSKQLIAYFSASGTTKKRAEKLAEMSKSDFIIRNKILPVN